MYTATSSSSAARRAFARIVSGSLSPASLEASSTTYSISNSPARPAASESASRIARCMSATCLSRAPPSSRLGRLE